MVRFYEIKVLSAKAIVSVACIFIAICLSLNCLSKVSTANSSQTWRESADWIYQQSNYIFNDDTLIITTQNSKTANGWCEYYVTRQGRRDALNVVSQFDLSEESLPQYNRIYLLALHSGTDSWLADALSGAYALERAQYGVKEYVRMS